MDLDKLVQPFSPWLLNDAQATWKDRLKLIPDFRRVVFSDLINDLEKLKQIISITGPRRVGKSTILLQIVRYLLTEKKLDPSRVIYYQLDDPALFRANAADEDVMEALMLRMCNLGKTGPAYLFLDEIQTYERWELHLKKYYDLQYPIKIIISGSASSPIFKKSRESLMGRVKDFHLLPFSFREFLLYQLRDNKNLVAEINRVREAGDQWKGMFVRHPEHLDLKTVSLPHLSDELWNQAQAAFDTYVVEGGFPEVWSMPSSDKKMEYLYDNQVKKVITEDLVLATEFRKPEQLKKFYISLLEHPGREVNLTGLSNDIGVGVQQIEKYLPLLEMTDLIRSAGKFRKSSIRLRRGNQKYYLVDVGLRNAVLRIGAEVLADETAMGMYAENLVFNALKNWPGVLQVDYYKEGNKEVDFIVHTRPSVFFPVEVKYRNEWDRGDLVGMDTFRKKTTCHVPLVITKDRKHFGKFDDDETYFLVPLLHFLILFD